MLLQLVLGIARRQEALHAFGPGQVLRGGAQSDGHQHQQEHRP